MFMKCIDGVCVCKIKRKIFDFLEIIYVFECLGDVIFDCKLY